MSRELARFFRPATPELILDDGAGYFQPERPLQPEDEIQQVRPHPLHAPEIREAILGADRLARKATGVGHGSTDRKPLRCIGRRCALRSEEFRVRQRGTLRDHPSPLSPVPSTLVADLLDEARQEIEWKA